MTIYEMAHVLLGVAIGCPLGVFIVLGFQKMEEKDRDLAKKAIIVRLDKWS